MMEVEDGVMGIVLLALFLFIAGALCVGCREILGANLAMAINAQPSDVSQLVDLRSVDGVSGRIAGSAFLLSGYIGTSRYYFWYEKAGDAITPRQLEVGKGVYVYEQERSDARLEVFDWHFKSAFGVLANNPGGRTWRFYVPLGTVRKQVQLQ